MKIKQSIWVQTLPRRPAILSREEGLSRSTYVENQQKVTNGKRKIGKVNYPNFNKKLKKV